MNECLVYAIVIALLIVAILFSVCDSAKTDEGYSNHNDNDEYQFEPVMDFLTRRQCYFTQPDYGQLSYAGCRCSRVGTMMNNGEVTYDDSGLYEEPL